MYDHLRIFQIGFNKCATASIYQLFDEYCVPTISSIHWHRGYLARDIQNNIIAGTTPLDGYESFSVFTNMECFRTHNESINWVSIGMDYFDLLDLNYPNSKFILNTRDIDGWIESRLRHVCHFAPMRYGYTKRLQNPESYMEYHKQAYQVDNTDELIKIWRSQWYIHHDNVLTHFAGRPNDLLVYNIDKDPFAKLIDFFMPCGLVFETDELPHANNDA